MVGNCAAGIVICSETLPGVTSGLLPFSICRGAAFSRRFMVWRNGSSSSRGFAGDWLSVFASKVFVVLALLAPRGIPHLPRIVFFGNGMAKCVYRRALNGWIVGWPAGAEGKKLADFRAEVCGPVVLNVRKRSLARRVDYEGDGTAMISYHSRKWIAFWV